MESLSWKVHEYKHRERGLDWYAAVIVITLSIIVSAVIFNNILFAVLIFIATVGLLLFAKRTPREINVSITATGVRLDEYYYPYANLESFWVADEVGICYLKSKKALSPHIKLYFAEDISGDDVREFLKEYLPEEEHGESVLHHFMDYLGL